jgi:hypothetical protein
MLLSFACPKESNQRKRPAAQSLRVGSNPGKYFLPQLFFQVVGKSLSLCFPQWQASNGAVFFAGLH